MAPLYRSLHYAFLAPRLLPYLSKRERLLLDSRVMDMPMASNPTCVLLSSWKPFCFNGLENALCFAGNAGA